MLSLYKKFILPKLLNRGMGNVSFNETRAKIVSPAQGVVLEIGFGSGYNLPFYGNIEKLYALEPAKELAAYAADRARAVSFPVEYLRCSAEAIPLPENSGDTVVSTWTLCSIPDVVKALQEVRRVLKPGGRFLFVEHGQHVKKINITLQKLATPCTVACSGNCHLDRNIETLIRESGLHIERIEMFPEEGRPLMYSYRGVAAK